jgi:predicted glycosyltransferase
MRFLFYSHDGLGLGHTRRNLAIASALTELSPEACVLIATGIDEIRELGLPDHISTLKLPGLRKTQNDTYVARRLRVPSGEIRALRSALLKATVQSFRPSVVLVDKHPFGASGEFRDGLELLREQGGKAVLGLRDILDDPGTVLREWSQHNLLPQIASFYDLLLVYGHPWIFNSCAEYSFPEPLAERTRFCGYVVGRDETSNKRASHYSFAFPDRSRPVVLATTGGGEDGFSLLETFLRACKGAPWQGIVIAGPMTPMREFESIEQQARETDVPVYRFVPGLARIFPGIDAIVCMGGYNTLAEALSSGLPAVCVPRTSPRREQWIRAQAFQRHGFLNVIEPEQFTEEALRKGIDVALQTPRHDLFKRVSIKINFQGAQLAATELLKLATNQTSTVPPVESVAV